MGKRDRFDAFVAGAGKNAKSLLNKAIQAADQTDDGKFGFADVAVIAEGIGSVVKKGAQEINDLWGFKIEITSNVDLEKGGGMNE